MQYAAWILSSSLFALISVHSLGADQRETIHVRPGESIQAALERAAEEGIKRVVVHAGTYSPPSPRQAMIWFNARHDGITLEARGEVVLSAANPDLADPSAPSYPAIVNHVVYFGDGVGSRTTLRGFKITGANNFVTRAREPEIQPEMAEEQLKKTLYFYTDGGAIKIFGRSYPILENLEIYDNYSSPCGAGVSVEHRGFLQGAVTIRNCIFRNNRVPVTGAAIDLLDLELGSSAVIENCIFVGNLSNCPMDEISRETGSPKPKAGHGALTVFPYSRATVKRSTFVGNRNGVDDEGPESVYSRCIFWNNTAPGGWQSGPRYETNIKNGQGVSDSFIGGVVVDARGGISPDKNTLNPEDPRFDDSYDPQSESYRDVGYRSTAEPAN
jgi:hypothetical protein